jgi:hypothetical protein
MACSICCENFNASNHLMVECKGCDISDAACRTCCKTYILNSQNDPMCMFCKTPWEREFIIKNLTKTFVEKDLKRHNEDLFVERQISLLPETQAEAIKEKKTRELKQHLLNARNEKDRLKKLIKDQDEIISSYLLEINRVYYGTSTEDTANENFTIKCCGSDCNGFLDNKYYCSMCETKYCKMCMEVKEDGHVCNEETKATVQAIKKESKPCPGCGERISKIDGCDQMWCIKCHIQFSWRTGQKMEGYNHNPEYFRWLRESGQEIDRNPYENVNRQTICGVQCCPRYIMRTATNLFPNRVDIVTAFTNIYRFYRHAEWLVGTIPERELGIEKNLTDLRVKYLLKDIGKEQWKFEIQKIDKQNKKNSMYDNIWRLIRTVFESNIEKFIVYTNEQKNQSYYLELLQDFNTFKEYVNLNFLNISDTFGSQTSPGITDDWREASNFKRYLKNKLNLN